MRRNFSIPRLACLWAALLGIGAGTVAADGFRVVAVEVRGASRVAPDDVRKVMGTQAGQELDLEKVRQDVKAIYRMGYFRDVTFDTEEVPGGYRLTVIVAEKPIVGGVQVEGNKDVETADLRAAVTVKERSLFQEEKVKESVSKLLEVCQNKGFIDASVEASVAEDSEGALRVTFRVAEGPKLKIERIVVTGNRFHSAKAIRKVMDTSEKGFFSFLSDSGTFKKDVIETDVRKLEGLYQNSGFLDSKIFEPVVARGKKGLIITIRIFEGRQYRVGEVRFSGESGIPEERLRKTVKLNRGDLFNRETLLSDLLALTTLVNDEGYAQALVSPGVEKRKEYPVADVTYRFERGTKFRFGKVEISGNTKTMDRIVRHNLDVSDGRTYTATGLKTSKENLTRTSYFKDVKISTAPSTVPGEMDAKVEVVEGPTGTLSGGLGYSSLDKIFGVIQLSENNLFGRGWRASLNSQFGARRTTYSIDFRDPHFLDSDFSLLLSAYNTRVLYTDFERKAIGGRAGLGYNFTRFTNASLSLRADGTRILPTGTAASQVLLNEFAKGLQHTRSITFSLNRNTTDKFIDPSRGGVQSGSVEYAGGPLGGDSQFVKYFLNAKAFYPVTATTVFSWNALWAHVVPTVGGGEIPIFERFFLGGPYSIRGFRSRELSPRDPNTGEAIGGNKELVGNLEYLFPLVSEINFKGVVFFDVGNTWAQGQWPWAGEQLRYAYGAGVRWYSPMGPLRFEWGWNLKPGPGESKRVMEFTIGTAF
ncbi:MAG: outer membrane protein assembly factor BamA [Deltaproteobacteria bacterium]|uniref:outer membrane protein assembly factor BamA n=1 Tax=Candidatus Deferrimicrobium sp. TaxID=3060586 RepID=UPI00271BE536|nr:outer membrane protein assembly factor BamA [Candidatus Deferrimicrobium sp.]MCR4309537.1 outer membrane protein assembly factor BamA [Deltaproteobacteria bacterium]MDO8738986.1 outer membrane protein assembly factor BamA [Candidatus Deferrimicrobium sp.]